MTDNQQGREAVAVTQAQRDERARQYGEQHRGERDAFDEMQRIRAGEWDASIARDLVRLAHATERASTGEAMREAAAKFCEDASVLAKWEGIAGNAEIKGEAVERILRAVARDLRALPLPAPAVEQPGRASEVERLRATLRRANAHIAAMVKSDDRDGITRRLLSECSAALAAHPDQAGETGT